MAGDQAERRVDRQCRLDLGTQAKAGIVAVGSRAMFEPHPARQFDRPRVARYAQLNPPAILGPGNGAARIVDDANIAAAKRQAVADLLRKTGGKLDFVKTARIVAEPVDRFQLQTGGLRQTDLGRPGQPQLAVGILRHGRCGEDQSGCGKKDGAHGVPVIEAAARVAGAVTPSSSFCHPIVTSVSRSPP